MKILHVITRLINGGAQLNTVLCCEAQVRAGHEVHLAYGPIYGPEGSLYERAKASGAVLHEVKPLVRAVHPWKDHFACRALEKLCLDIEPTIVHTHSSKAGIVGRIAAWRAKGKGSELRVIHTVHGLPFHDRQAAIVRRAYVAAERFAAKRCDRLVALTPAMVDAFVGERIAMVEKFDVVPSGVELEKFARPSDSVAALRAEFGLPVDAVVVGVVARLDPLKGQADLIEIVPKLLERFPGLRLFFVGDGFYRDALEKMVEEAGSRVGGGVGSAGEGVVEAVGGAVVFGGMMDSERVVRAMAAMDVMALPSYQEGQGRVLVEALACGCPIVGYDAGGIGAVCVDGVTGFLAKVGDRDGLLKAIERTLSDPVRRRTMLEAGRRHVEANYSVGAMTDGLMRVYEVVLTV